MYLKRLAITGADDNVSIYDLYDLSKRYPIAEWGILIHLDKDKESRYPSKEWRDNFLNNKPDHAYATAHLCGRKIFSTILTQPLNYRTVLLELKKYTRIQLNINAKKEEFTKEAYLRICRQLIKEGLSIVLQYNQGTERIIDFVLRSMTKHDLYNISVLYDESKGTGTEKLIYREPMYIRNKGSSMFSDLHTFYTGCAGGLNLLNIIPYIKKLNETVKIIEGRKDNILYYWLDLETGARIDDVFNITIVNSILKQVTNHIRSK